MKGSVVFALLLTVLLIPAAMATRPHIASRRRLSPQTGVLQVRQLAIEGGGEGKHENGYIEEREIEEKRRRRGETVEIAGSRIPDCSHACGSCSPCRLVTVRFFCASVEESETCPMAYKCMCSNKSFPVP